MDEVGTARGASGSLGPLLRAGAIAAFLIALGILAAGVLFTLSQATATSPAEEMLRDIHRGRIFWILAHASFLGISLLLIPLTPAVYLLARGSNPLYRIFGCLAWLAAAVAGILPVTLALALVPLSDTYASAPDATRAAVAAGSEAIRTGILVSFGVLGTLVGAGTALLSLGSLRSGRLRGWLVWLGVVGGILFALGTVFPPLLFLFIVANVLGFVWFVGLGFALRGSAARPDEAP